MKKIIITIFFLFLLTSCFGSKSEVEKAKEDIFSSGEVEVNNETSTGYVDNNTLSGTISNDEEQPEDTSYYKVEKIISNDDLDVKPILDISSSTQKIEVNGIVNNPEINKIVIGFSNSTSKFPKDTHTLTQFKKGDTTFLYRAFREYEVLDTGLNEYQIDGYVDNNLVSSIKLLINIPKENTNTSSTGEISTGSTSMLNTTEGSGTLSTNLGSENNNLFLSLPVDENNYGKPVMLGTSEFTYSNINGLDIKIDENVFNYTCENIEEYLSANYSWYYWNTCRPIGGTNGVYTNVLFLDGEDYIYNRVYLDKKHGLFGKVLLEKGTGVTKDNLSEKNTELKGKSFDILAKTDKLFNDLLK